MIREKIQLIMLGLAAILVLTPGVANAQDAQSQAEVDAIRDAVFVPQDFDIPVATIAPDHFLYGVKNAYREVIIYFSLDDYSGFRRRIEILLERFGEIELLMTDYDTQNLVYIERLLKYIESDLDDAHDKIKNLNDDEKRLAYIDIINAYYAIQTGLDNAETRAANHERLLILSLSFKNKTASLIGGMIDEFDNGPEFFTAAHNTLSTRNAVSSMGELVRWGYILRLSLHSDVVDDYVQKNEDDVMVRLGDTLREKKGDYVDAYFRYARIDPELLLQWLFRYNSKHSVIPVDMLNFENKMKSLVIERYYEHTSHAMRDLLIESYDTRNTEDLLVFLLWLSDDIIGSQKHFMLDAYYVHKRKEMSAYDEGRTYDIVSLRALFDDRPVEIGQQIVFNRALSVYDLIYARENAVDIPFAQLDSFLTHLEYLGASTGEEKVLFETIQNTINQNESIKALLVEYAGNRVTRLLVPKEVQDLDKSNRLRENTNFRL